MVAKDHYNWPLIAKQAAQLIREGKAKPNFKSLERALDIHANTLTNGFYAHFKMRAKDLPNLVNMKFGEEEISKRYDGIDPNDVIKLLKKKDMPLSELADRLDRGSQTVERALFQMQADGYGIVMAGKVSLPQYTPPIRFPPCATSRQRPL